MIDPKGKIETRRFGDEAAWLRARKPDLTASTIAALFGIHEFVTPYALWAEKSGKKKTSTAENEAIRRGKLMEPIAVSVLRHDFPELDIVHNSGDAMTYFRDPVARIGATPDTLVECPERGLGTIQIKSVEASIYRKKWCANGEPEPPLWIAIQVAVEAHLTGSAWAAVAPIVVGHGIEVPLIEIPLSDKVVSAVYAKAAEFWAMIERGDEPEPDFSLDGGVIDSLYAGDGTEIDLSDNHRVWDLVVEYGALYDRHKADGDKLEAIKAELKHAMKGSELAYLRHGKRMTWRRQTRRFSDGTTSTNRVLRVPKFSDVGDFSAGEDASQDLRKPDPKLNSDRWNF